MMKQQKVSLICPVYNEEKSIRALIESMLSQSRKANEIIFVDSFSNDKTANIILEYKKRGVRLIQEKSNIAKARNIAIKKARYEIIAATDASCKLDKDWLKNITKPLEDNKIDVVSGGFVAVSEEFLEKYLAMVTVKPMNEWDEKTFLPSGRSIAFRKKVWKAVGGYPEAKRKSQEAGEDTLFDLKLKEKGFKFKLAKDAVAYWRGRNTIKKFSYQFYRYGRGDIENGNLAKMKTNLLSFIGLNLWVLLTIVFLFIKPFVSILLVSILLIYFILGAIKISIKRKDYLGLIFLPWLLMIKRFSYFVGLWRGLI